MARSCSEIRKEGYKILKGNWTMFSIALAFFFGISALIGFVVGEIFSLKLEPYNIDFSSILIAFVCIVVLVLVNIILTPMAECGASNICLRLYDEEDVGFKSALYGFNYFIKAIGLFLWQALFTALWSMLFIIPGIIAALRYSQSFFIFVENPEKSIRGCVNESKLLMDGNLMKYFKLSLSYIGWIILAVLPSGIISGIASNCWDFNTYSLLNTLALIVEIIAMSILMPYIYSGMVVFYKNLTRETDEKSEVVVIEKTIQ